MAYDVLDLRHAAVVMVSVAVLMVMVVIVVMAVLVIMVMLMMVVVVVLMLMMMLVVVLMLVAMAVARRAIHGLFLFAMDFYRHMGPQNAALAHLFLCHRHAWDRQRVQLFQEFFRFGQQFQQGGCQHIPCGAHAAIQIQCLHFFASM